jgi:hypothetical protein
MKKLASILALSSAFVSFNAHAWGNDGHRAVGAIADQLIKGSKAEQQVQALLLPGESLAGIASWADCVKGTYCGPQTPEMVAYTTANPSTASTTTPMCRSSCRTTKTTASAPTATISCRR